VKTNGNGIVKRYGRYSCSNRQSRASRPPKNVREELAIEPGDLMKVTIHGNEVMLQPKKDTSGFVRRGKARIFSSDADHLLKRETVEAILAEERERRGVEIGRSLSPRKRKQ
jgi:bifunctional DNA-binding transcriptional regulator/antitoxin component of YhaV-PrlF toxin-antitoxin module